MADPHGGWAGGDVVVQLFPNSPHSAEQPRPRAWHGACAVGNNKVLVFGGCDFSGRVLSDTWVLDLHADPPVWNEIKVRGRVYVCLYLGCWVLCAPLPVLAHEDPQKRKHEVVVYIYRMSPGVASARLVLVGVRGCRKNRFAFVARSSAY